VPERPLTDEEQGLLVAHLSERLPGTVTVELKLLQEIARSAGGKYEDFVNEVGRLPKSAGQ